MPMRIYFLFLMMMCVSCNSFLKEREDIQELDTIVDFTKVDKPPIFKKCRNKANAESQKCFENTVCRVFRNHFSEIVFTYKDTDIPLKTVIVFIKFDKHGKATLKKIKYFNSFLKENRIFAVEVEKAIKKLPFFSSATKRGVPTTTLYKLPIEQK